MNRNELTEQIVVNRLTRGLTWQSLADAIDRPVVWTTSALLGQHPIPPEQAKVLAEMLGLEESALPVLAARPRSRPGECRPTPPSTASTRRCRCTAVPSRSSSTSSSATAS